MRNNWREDMSSLGFQNWFGNLCWLPVILCVCFGWVGKEKVNWISPQQKWHCNGLFFPSILAMSKAFLN